MRVRIRGPSGQAAISLSETATVEDLKTKITEKTSISNFELKYGYPPRPLSLSHYADTAKLSNLGIKLDEEQLIVSEVTPSVSKQAPSANGRPKPVDPSSIAANTALSSSSAVTPSSVRTFRNKAFLCDSKLGPCNHCLGVESSTTLQNCLVTKTERHLSAANISFY